MRRVRRIRLRDFRSYEEIDVPLTGQSVALTGPNGAGKTNLLEALSMMGPGRGLRRAVLGDLTRQGATGDWGVGLTLGQTAEELTLSAQAAGTPPRKTLRIDGEPVSSATALLDYVRFSWLTPAQDRLFVEGASERRRFLDRMTMAQDKTHGTISSAYEKSMRQRQAVLETPSPDAQLLSVLEQQMAEYAVAIAAARRHTASILMAGYDKLRSGAFPAASLALEGRLEMALATEHASDVEEAFCHHLYTVRRRDAEVGRALDGPHRSDFLVTHIEKDQPARLCSTGEQKALLIGLVLAHAASLSGDHEAPLVLLLDEVAAHLDEARRAALADILDGLGGQVFMTGTDTALFAPWGARAQHFDVRDGGISALDL